MERISNNFIVKVIFKAAAVTALLASISVVSFSQSTTEASISAQYLYASTYSADGSRAYISGYRVNDDGTLSSVGAPTVISGRATMVASKLGAKLFGVGRQRLWSFAVNPTTGRLKLLSVLRFPSNVSGIAIGINPQSTLLFVGKVIDAFTAREVRRITTYRISPSGALTPISSTVVPLEVGDFLGQARIMPVRPDGRFMYADTEVPELNFGIAQLQINQTTGAVTMVHNYSLGQVNALGDLVRSPGGGYLYQSFTSPQIGVFTVNWTTGALKQIQQKDCACDASPDEGFRLAISANGALLFQATGTPGGINVLSRNSTTGLLTTLPEAFVNLPNMPVFVTDATNRFLFVNDALESSIKTFRVGSDNLLSPVDGSGGELPADRGLGYPDLQVVAVRH